MKNLRVEHNLEINDLEQVISSNNVKAQKEKTEWLKEKRETGQKMKELQKTIKEI